MRKSPQEKYHNQAAKFNVHIASIDIHAPWRWLQLGWQDLLGMPLLSLCYGMIMTLVCVVIVWLSWQAHSFVLLLSMTAGFFFLGPALAIGLYAISRELQKNAKLRVRDCLRTSINNISSQLVLSLIFLIVFLLWARAASMLHIFFPNLGTIDMVGLLLFIVIGAVIGSLFATLVFSIGAFSIPMIMDQDIDSVSAAIYSIKAVANNKLAMLLWAFIIFFGFCAGVLLCFFGLVIILPAIGHATWHAYQEVIHVEA